MLLTAAFLAYKHRTSSSNLHQSGDRTDNNNNNNRGSTEDLVVLSRRVHSETIGRCFAPSNEDNWDNNNNITGGDERIRRRPEEPKAIPRMEKGERLMANLPPAALEENDHGGDNDQQQQDNIHTPLVSVSSFRNDVRNEWIQAVFGDALYEANTASNRKKKIGLANIAPYTSFEVKLKHPNSNADGGAAGHDDATDDRRRGVNNEHNKLGITLKMLTLGLYVRAIQPGSEAACAGIKPNSILISINGLVLLGEQSKTALERLWQYEGYHNSYNNNNNTQQCDDGIKAETTPPAVGIGDDDVIIQESVELVFIKGGQKYSVVFLSNPPYGIDWAPCGNFACIKRNLYPHLNNIPVGAIVAKVGSVQLEDDLDQIRCYEELRNFTSASYRSNVELSFHVCFAPPQTRSAYYERQQQQQNKADSQSKSSSSGAQATTLVEEQQSYHHLHHSKSHRPAVVAQHDGVEVRVHPMIWNPCSGEDDLHPQNHHRAVVNAAGGYLSKLAARVASGELYSLPQDRRRRRRQRAMRRRSQQPQQHVGNTTSGTNTTMQSLLSSFSSPAKQPSSNSNPVARKIIRSCPPLQSPLLDIWSVDDALLYLLEYHQSINSVKGNEAAEGSDWFVRTSSLSSDVASYLLRIIASRKDDRNKKTSTPFTDQAYLMHILNFFCRQHEQQYKVDLFSLLWSENDDEEFGHYYRMELLAQVMDLTELQRKLKMRREALKERELERGFSLPYLASPSRAITSTISTKSTMSMESIAPDGNSSNHIALLAPRHQSSSPVASVIIGSAETAVENMTVSTSARSPTAIDDIAVASPSTEVTASESSTKKKKKTKVSRRLFSFLRKQSKKSSSSRKKLAAVTNTSFSSEHSETKEIQNRLTPDKAPESRNVATNQNGDHNNVAFLSPKSPKRSLILRSPLRSRRLPSIDSGITECNSVSNNVTFSNTLLFLEELLTVCEDINKSLLSLSLTQKIASWALQPWSASKETFLAEVTLGMRQRLSRYPNLPLLDPIDFSHRLKTLDVEQCYILPSAHFPLLLTFDVDTASADKDNNKGQMSCKAGKNRASSVFGPEKLYRTTVELVQISTREASELSFSIGRRYLINASVAGTVLQSSPSSPSSNNSQTWNSENVFSFASRSSWGPPQTLSLSLTEVLSPNQEREDAQDGKDPITANLVSSEAKRKNGSSLPHDQSHAVGFCCVDLDSMWQEQEGGSSMNCGRETCHVDVWDSSFEFDDHGEIARGSLIHPEGLKLEIRVKTEIVIDTSAFHPQRSLLYKHDDDVRQETVATEFVKSCDDILKASGLELHLLSFKSTPVGKQRGFIEWVPGSVPLSEICQEPFSVRPVTRSANSSGDVGNNIGKGNSNDDGLHSSVAKAGLFKYEQIHRIRSVDPSRGAGAGGSSASKSNPIQEFLRSFAFDENDPYMIRKSVMERYVKSCAGYCVITYLLGVGDRHLDNLLLHPSGHFFHCDYSFILGHDPKKYQPLRLTQDMVNGMGGTGSDNFALFMSSTCAAFLTLRRPENVRHILSFFRAMEGCGLPEGNKTEGSKPLSSMEECLLDIRERLRLDLTEEEAIAYMEDLIHESRSSKMWIAVDAMHSIGKRF